MNRDRVGVAAAAGLVVAGALVLLRKRGGAKGKTFVLRSDSGIEVHVSEFGGLILRLLVPDKNGNRKDIVLGYDKLQEYIDKNTYYGALIGRCANRIAEGRFSHGPETYQLATNNTPNALHGGERGFDKVRWQAVSSSNSHVTLRRVSPDGEEGYPGNLTTTATYRLTDQSLKLTIDADTDTATPVNITQHSYFNLRGHDSGTILNHQLQIHGQYYTPKDKTSIPRGEVAPVVGTFMDFMQPRLIGSRLAQVPGGYDHNYVLSEDGGAFTERTAAAMGRFRCRPAAELHDPESGRTMTVSTNAPGLQFYSGNFMDGSDYPGKGGAHYKLHGGLCLEPQGLPNAVNEHSFPSVILKPLEHYRHEIIYDFKW